MYSTTDKRYPKGRKLETINLNDSSEYEPYIDPNERFILFSSNRKAAYGKLDIYISLNENGRWSKPVNLGKQINNGEAVYSPYVSPDSQFLFFNRKGDLYWVNFQLLLKSLNVNLNNE